jgi:hypothetical protein
VVKAEAFTEDLLCLSVIRVRLSLSLHHKVDEKVAAGFVSKYDAQSAGLTDCNSAEVQFLGGNFYTTIVTSTDNLDGLLNYNDTLIT